MLTVHASIDWRLVKPNLNIFQCHENMQLAIKTKKGLGIEYDENIVCDVCRSVSPIIVCLKAFLCFQNLIFYLCWRGL